MIVPILIGGDHSFVMLRSLTNVTQLVSGKAIGGHLCVLLSSVYGASLPAST